MRWRGHYSLIGTPTEKCSALQTATTTLSRVEAALRFVTAVGGMDHAAQATLTWALTDDG